MGLITDTAERYLNNSGEGVGKAFNKYKIGSLLRSLEYSTGERLNKVVATGDISGGKITLTASSPFASWGVVSAYSSEGVPREVTAVVEGAGNAIDITITSVAAGDTVNVTVYE